VKLLPYGSAPECDENPDFARWFQLYPAEHRVAKGAARREWYRLRPSKDQIAQMMAVLAQQKTSEKWRAGFVPSPANYIRDERWDDYVGPERRVEQRREWVCPHDPPCHNNYWCTSGIRDRRDAEKAGASNV
jgi:hypothetical protein